MVDCTQAAEVFLVGTLQFGLPVLDYFVDLFDVSIFFRMCSCCGFWHVIVAYKHGGREF